MCGWWLGQGVVLLHCACLLVHITYLLCLGSCGWLEFDRFLLVREGVVSPVRLTRLAWSGPSSALPKEVMPTKSEIAKCKLANTDLPKY
jgi:hypothetical protein